MSNQMYGLGAEAFLEGSIAGLSDTLACSLVASSYTVNLATDEFYNVISGGAIIAGPVSLTTVTGSAGTLSAANTVFSSISGSAASFIVMFKNTGTSSTSRLLVYYDTATGLPVTPKGGNITIAWASGVVFTLCESLAEQEQEKHVRARWKELLKELKKRWGVDKWGKSGGGLWVPEPSVVLG